MGSISDFLDTFVGRALGFGALYGLVFLFQIWKLDLLQQSALTFLTACTAWAIVWIVSILNTGKLIGTVAGLFLLWITFSSTLPHTAEAVKTKTRTMDEQIGHAIQQLDESTATTIAPPAAPVPQVAPGPRVLPMPTPQPEPDDEPFQAITEAPKSEPAPEDDGFKPILPRNP